MSTSLLIVVQNTPAIEPLPAYRRDPETSSIRSSAPSYVSEAPTYHSTIPQPSNPRQTGLPPANYAPGFHHFRNYDRNGLSHLNFSINQWSSVYSSPQARHYHNVAARRTNLAMIEEQAFLSNLANQNVFPTFVPVAPISTVQAPASQTNVTSQTSDSSSTSTANSATITQQPGVSTSSTTTLLTSTLLPQSPLEDPDLVGHQAATLARERRLYIARETALRRQRDEREAQAVLEETKRWDFMLSQMTEYEEKERNWKVFAKKLDARNAGRTGNGSAKKVLFRFWK